MSYGFTEFEVVLDGETLPATSCIVANSRGYGGGLLLTPEADMTDGFLDVLIVQGARRMGHFLFLLSAWRRSPRSFSWIHHRRVQMLTIRGKRGPWIQLDGELTGTLPVDISIVSSAFPLIVP
jgi:diacylglycerol kinase (ATP)